MEEKQKSILWIDDDINNPELASDRDALEERNCNITPVTSPDEFKLESIPSFDCIIIDLSMPVGKKLNLAETRYGSRTGFVIIKKIKEKYSNSKLIVYSVFDVPEVRSYCNENGIHYWNKSRFMSDEFADKVIKLIDEE